jgi:hypothetical protein
MLARWTVTYGPEFERSKADCALPPGRLQLHLDDFKVGLERDPLTFAEAYGDASRCVIEAKDYAYRVLVTAFVVLYQGLVAEIRWVAETPLADDDVGFLLRDP